MSITPTSQLFTAISAAELAKSGNRGTGRANPNAAAETGPAQNQAAQNQAGQTQKTAPRQAQTQQTQSQHAQKTAETPKPDASPTKATTEGEPGSTAAEFRREAVGPSRPQFQRPGQMVDLKV